MFRAFLNTANDIEPNKSMIFDNRVEAIYSRLVSSNEKIRLLNNQMRFYVKDSGNDDLASSFIGENIPIYELSERSQIINRKMSLD